MGTGRGGRRASLALAGPVLGPVLCLFLLAGCGGSDDAALDPAGSTPTSSESSSVSPTAVSPTMPPTSATTSTTTSAPPSSPPKPLPACGDVWVSGKRLPRAYRGCSLHGVDQKPKSHPCELTSPIIEFDNRFYAVAGSRINETPDLAHDRQFHSAVSACQA